MISVNFDNAQVGSTLLDLVQRLKDPSSLMEAIGAEVEGRVAGRFETRTDPSGQPWAQWSRATSESYPEDGRRQLLQRTGAMVGSLNWDANGSTAWVGFSAVASRNGDVYAVYHEFGTDRMPRRGLLMADPVTGTLALDDVAAIEALLVSFYGP